MNSNNSKAATALRDVIDPEIGLNVVDLGLIYNIIIEEENKKVSLFFTLTTQYCPMGESIANSIGNALQLAFPDYNIVVEFIFEPPWTHEMISETGRKFLNR